MKEGYSWIVVLEDGKTFSEVTGCRLVILPDAAFDTDGDAYDADDIIAKADELGLEVRSFDLEKVASICEDQLADMPDDCQSFLEDPNDEKEFVRCNRHEIRLPESAMGRNQDGTETIVGESGSMSEALEPMTQEEYCSSSYTCPYCRKTECCEEEGESLVFRCSECGGRFGEEMELVGWCPLPRCK